MDWSLYTISGFVVGGIIGLTGVGGGSLMTPILVLFFGIPATTAVGTDLLYASITKSGGAIVHHKQGNVQWRIVFLLTLGSLPASILSIWIISRTPSTYDMTQIINYTLGLALFLTAGALLFDRVLRQNALNHANDGLPQRHLGFITVLTGAILGALVSISSVGAGALGVAILLYLYPHLLPAQIVGSDISHAVPITLVAGLGHWWLGHVDFTLLGSLLLGSLPGIYLGSHAAARVPEWLLRRMLAIILMLVGGKMLLS